MQHSKLLDLLRTFTRRDLRRFTAFIQSPYFNTDAEVVALFAHLRGLSPRFPERKLQREVIWRAVYPDQPYDEKALAYHQSHLLQLGEQFLAFERVQSRPQELSLHALVAVEDRGLEKHANLARKRLHKQVDAYAFRTEEYYRMQYETTAVEIMDQSRRQVRTYDRFLQEHVRHLDHFYLAARLRLTCELVNRQNILAQQYAPGQVDALLDYLAAQGADQVPAVAVYHCVLLLLTSPEGDTYFLQLKGLLQAHVAVVPDPELAEIYSYVQNFCILRIRSGRLEYLTELFAVYQQSLAKGYFLENGVLSPWKYKNIASVALRVGEFAWVQNFIRDYKEALPTEFRETAYAYNQAFLCYQQGQLKQALRNLRDVEFNDVFYSLDTRKMMLMIYFEQGEEEPMLSLIAAFRTYLRRNKLISEKNRRAYWNFIDLVNAIHRAEQTVEGLQIAIRSTQPLVEEQWLVQMTVRGF
ncbi:MAG: hypothetical protein AAGN35_25830 [Bacteroidota bacterium]